MMCTEPHPLGGHGDICSEVASFPGSCVGGVSPPLEPGNEAKNVGN